LLKELEDKRLELFEGKLKNTFDAQELAAAKRDNSLQTQWTTFTQSQIDRDNLKTLALVAHGYMKPGLQLEVDAQIRPSDTRPVYYLPDTGRPRTQYQPSVGATPPHRPVHVGQHIHQDQSQPGYLAPPSEPKPVDKWGPAEIQGWMREMGCSALIPLIWKEDGSAPPIDLRRVHQLGLLSADVLAEILGEAPASAQTFAARTLLSLISDEKLPS
jgi:hypothetical protein